MRGADRLHRWLLTPMELPRRRRVCWGSGDKLDLGSTDPTSGRPTEGVLEVGQLVDLASTLGRLVVGQAV